MKLPPPTLAYEIWESDTLDETFLSNMGVYQAVIFCVGVGLLFSKERGRRRGRLDWTRRWGVLCSYVTFLLSAANIVIITALVVVGIGANFLGMPLKHQPAVTQLLVNVGAACVRFGGESRAASFSHG